MVPGVQFLDISVNHISYVKGDRETCFSVIKTIIESKGRQSRHTVIPKTWKEGAKGTRVRETILRDQGTPWTA